MAIDLDTFQKLLKINSDDMLELVDTVNMAARLNERPSFTHDTKIALAGKMIKHTCILLEQCGCHVNLDISNSGWSKSVVYRTGEMQ